MEESPEIPKDVEWDQKAAAAPHEKQISESLQQIFDHHKKAQAETNAYLEKHLARPLSLALSAVVKAQPLDATGYLVQWLRHYVGGEQRNAVSLQEQQSLAARREEVRDHSKAVERERDAEAERFDSQGHRRDDNAFLESLASVEWMGEKEFQNTLDYLRDALGVCAAYVTRLHHSNSMTDPTLHYIYADSDSKFLVDRVLRELQRSMPYVQDEGILWEALAETEEEVGEEPKEDDSSTDGGEEEANRDSSSAETDVGGPKRAARRANSPAYNNTKILFIPDTMEEDKMKFWAMTRPGSFAAVPIIFDDPACKESVDAIKRYLLESRDRDKIIKERQEAKEQARQEKQKTRQQAGALSSRGRNGIAATFQGESGDEDETESGDYDDAEGEDELPPPVPEPELVEKRVKMILCVDTLGGSEGLSPEQLRRLQRFAVALKEQCLRTREAAVRKQAEAALDEETLNNRISLVEAALEEEQNETAAQVEVEKKKLAEELEAKIQREKEECKARRQVWLENRAEDKRRREEERQKREQDRRMMRERQLQRQQQGEQQQATEIKRESAGSERVAIHSRDTVGDGKQAETDGLTQHEGKWQEAREAYESGRAELSDEDERDQEEEAEGAAQEGDSEAQEEGELVEPLDPSVFLEEAEARVKFEKATHTLTYKLGDVLLDMQHMFIPTTPAVVSTTAAALLLLGDSPAALRVNSSSPESELDWEKIRSKIEPSLIDRISSFNPAAPRHKAPFRESVPKQETALLLQIVRLIEETNEDEKAPPLSSLALLTRWLELAVDYRRKHLIATAMNLYRDAKMNKRTAPQLEEDVDPDFTGVSLERVLNILEG
ncbi:hypothetical protein BESB_084460 [Besnoitia besnoiti]|uniref:Dpy-30 motif protein n=1 Tax=Besnoitia besnoiti TaxID=94643 RepID=A0A2A9MCB1_BESBE|nr:hypothetical protein BESB_084460 [Besnoitia besnoiti]PFH33247.1 hypothetical protein BESB_084460 [Besnoitia besnoiti]